MRFDTILTNPPFQDSTNRKKTPHKLWIDFTVHIFDRLLADGGSLLQVSPASFASPSNVVLRLMGAHRTRVLRLDTGHHFPQVASTFSDYWIQKLPHDGAPTDVRVGDEAFSFVLDDSVAYLPNDLSQIALSIHRKVMFSHRPRLAVEWDYVTAHNIRRHDAEPSLVTEPDDDHPYPVFHTNRSTWWSSIRQGWADAKKVMWTRSGYTKPFYDDGQLGGTDMVYFVRVNDEAEGKALAANLNTELFRYIFKTAKWSGFGNERVFAALPQPPLDRAYSDVELADWFGLTAEEVAYVGATVAPRARQTG